MDTFRMIENFLNGYESVDYRVLTEDKNLVLLVYLPGTKKSDVKIRVENHVLKISAKDKIGYDKWEYSKSWHLPSAAITESIQSSMTDGVLKVVIPTSINSRNICVE